MLQFTSTTGAAVNMRISGTNIPANTFATAVTATSITLSNNVTGAGVGAGGQIVIAPENFVGVSAAAPPVAPNNNYSRIHVFLRGAFGATSPTTPPFVYTGAAPQRMLTYAEYCFIRAEAALRGAPGSAQQFYTDGITASMQEVGVAAIDISNYLAANGTLVGTTAQQIFR
ncbi:MAG: SusD/RagB family nutrient-binding outer membrane lipoprotein [Chitinophagaceae bacterium]|nr:SusD/RagB family nutrient-binding outer membrane lipoprotein [Chitinophagaceae bacterium]